MIVLVVQSCASPLKLHQSGNLLVKTKIQTNDDRISESDLDNLIVQKANATFLRIPWKARIYQRLSKKRKTKVNKWVMRTFGEKPVIFDRSASETTVRQMGRYLDNKGYFDRTIRYDVSSYSNNTDRISYKIDVDKPYTIAKISYEIKDSLVGLFIRKIESESLLSEGMVYDAYLLDDERDRITSYMRNHGFYFFNKDFITYTVDSTLGNKRMALTMMLDKRTVKDEDGNLVSQAHKQYRVNEVFMYPEYDPFYKQEQFDTLRFYYRFKPSDTGKTVINFVHKGKFIVKPMPLARAVMMRQGSLYSIDGINKTVSRFGSMNITKYVKVDFEDIGRVDSLGKGLLNLHIRQNLKPIHYISNGTEFTNSAGYLGLALNLTYMNRNIFRGAESFRLQFTGAVENQQQRQSDQKAFLGFNTMEFGVNAEIQIPKFLLPFRADRFSADYKPRTSLTFGYNYQRRIYYTRYISNVSIGYKWRSNSYSGHYFIPWELNSVKIYVTDDAFSRLLADFDKRFQEQYTNHLISATRYSYLFNNQYLNHKNFSLIRWNIEAAGNTYNLFHRLTGAAINEKGHYELLNIRYAQYLRTDIDYRYYMSLGEKTSLAFRGVFGIGVRYGNSDALPFEKGFFVGGANGLRGWSIRSLGPGASNNTKVGLYDKVGDIQLEFNSEYRFPIQGMFLGALFFDAGNIWLLHPSDDYPNGEFRFDKFYKQVAMDAGLGIRVDVQFFIFRIDAAVKVHDPSVDGDRWVVWDQLQKFRNIHWNFGIGHTF